MVPRHLRTIARQQSAADTGYMILGDMTRIPVVSLAGEYLEHLRQADPVSFGTSKQHLFKGKPQTNQGYRHYFVDRIGDKPINGHWRTSAYDPEQPYSQKYLGLEGANWTLAEYIGSGSIFTREHKIILTLAEDRIPQSVADALIGQGLTRLIDLPDPFIWTRSLKISEIHNSSASGETSVILDVQRQAQTSLIRPSPDPGAEKAANDLIVSVQRLLRKAMRERSLTKASLAIAANVPEEEIIKALTKGGEGPSLRLLAILLHTMGLEARIEIKQEGQRAKRTSE